MWVEGRKFNDTLSAFTFAQIQADRMQRPVEVHYEAPRGQIATWHATAYPTDYRRQHLVVENSPSRLFAAA